jgi:hypothetical protein
VNVGAEVRRLIRIDGSDPVAIRVVDVTPEGHATSLFAVVIDFGWCETVSGSGYEKETNAFALALGAILEVPVETTIERLGVVRP